MAVPTIYFKLIAYWESLPDETQKAAIGYPGKVQTDGIGLRSFARFGYGEMEGT